MEKTQFSKDCFYFLICSIFGVFSSNAQVNKDYNDNINRYNLSPPDVYSFEKYKLNPAHHQVGKLDINIPIVTIKTGNIEYPINLVYNSGGIKVDQLASNVGLGWSLTSAVITRTVNQLNDFDNFGSLTLQTNYNSLPQSDKDNNMSAWIQDGYSGKIGYLLQNETNRKININYKSVDFIPDQYNVYCPGYTTNFFFDTFNTVKEINPKGTRIQYVKGMVQKDSRRGYFGYFSGLWEPNYNFYTQDLLSIIITTNDGIRYTFSDCDYSLSQPLKDGDVHRFDSPAQVSAWHITKIEDTKTGKKIDFVYENASSNPNNFYSSPAQNPQGFYYPGAQRSYEYVENPDTTPSGCRYYVPYTFTEGTYKLQISARVDVETKRLKRIIYEEGQVVFNYNNEGVGSASGTGRNDIYNGDYVSQIYIKDTNLTTLKTYNFGYFTFTSDYNVGEFNPDGPMNTFRYKRLKLTELREVGKPAYKFYYDETVKLPPVNSFSVDFLGYYNNSPDVTSTSVIASTRPNPTLYYYPNQFEKSLLPFPIPGMTGLTIPGIFDRRANANYAKAWSLNKIEYPTGGSSEYVYESNKFELFGQTIDGGGVRIAQQLLKDGNGNTRTINYTYNNSSGGTSGSLYNIPYFGHATKLLFNVVLDFPTQDPDYYVVNSPTPAVTNTVDWKLFDKSNLNADIASGSYVGYSNVTESEVGLGRKELMFTSNNLPGFANELRLRITQMADNVYSLAASGSSCMSEFMIANTAFGSNLYTDNSYKRGKLMEEKIYDDSNQLIRKKTINYQDNLISTHSYTQGFTQPLHTASEDNLAPFMSVIKKFKVAQYLPINEVITNYFTPTNFIDEVANYTYNSDGFIKTKEEILTNGQTSKTEFFYPTEVSNLNSLPGIAMSLNDKSMYQYMVSNANNKGEKIQINSYDGANLISSYRTTFRIFNPTTNFSNIITPSSVMSAKGVNNLERKIEYTKYDDNNNLTEYIIENDKPVALVWGYNKSRLIAKVENVFYANISAATITNLQQLSNVDFDNCKESICKEQLLRNALSSFRSTLTATYPNSNITTYTYDPIIGITSITDLKGDTVYYSYDVLERLITVKDKYGNIITTHEYNYKPQN